MTARVVEKSFEIVNDLGLHARAAAKLVRCASGFSSTIQVSKDGQTADAKSIMGVLLLCGEKGAMLSVRAEGEDAERAVETIGELIASRFGEDS